MSNSIVPLMAAVDGYVLAPSVNARCPLAAKLNVSLPIWLSSAIARPQNWMAAIENDFLLNGYFSIALRYTAPAALIPSYQDVGEVLVNTPLELTWNPSTFTAGPEEVIFKVPKRPITCGYNCVSVIAWCCPCGNVNEGCSRMAPLASKNVRNTEISCDVDGFTSARPEV